MDLLIRLPLKYYLFISSLLFFFSFSNPSANYSSDTLIVNPTGRISLSGTINKPYHSTLRNLRAEGLSQRKVIINNALDSLGYLDSEWIEASETQAYYLIPGNRYTVTEIKLSADTSLIKRGDIPAIPRPYDMGEINKFISRISSRFAQNGYPFSRVITSIEKLGENNLSIEIEIDSDMKTLFAPPLIYGEVQRSKLYIRDIGFEQGELFDIRRVDRAAARLRNRSYVSSVEINAPVIIEGLEQGNDSTYFAAVPFMITERSGMNLEGALGFESGGSQTGIRGRFDLSLINIFHRGESAQLQYFGDKSWQRLLVGIKMPWIFNTSFTGGAEFGLEIEELGYGQLWGDLSLKTEIAGSMNLGVVLRGSEVVPGDEGSSWTFFGADLVLSLFTEPYQMGVLGKEFSIKTGSGFARRERMYSRSKMELSGGIHMPLYHRHAVVGRLFTKNIFTDEQELAPAELFRIGGNESVRGYSENEFVFRSLIYTQLEYLLYLNPETSVYFFIDAGSGFRESGLFDFSNRIDLLGYGAGLRFPFRIGSATIEWARNMQDQRSAGRVHVGLQNRF
ncbi:outer membrane protein [Chitinispirillum alkaliphilum]|nr:outer membrane protein [Chitinispirillum alkaliphilum]